MQEPESKTSNLKEIEALKLQNQKLKERIFALENLQKDPPLNTTIEQKYKAVIENAPWGIIVSVPGQNILEVNAAVCRIFGYTTEEFKIKRRADLVVSDEAFEQFLNQRNADGKAKGEVTGIRKNGEKFPMEFSSLVFTDESTGELRNSSIAIDISERKKIERLIRETNEVARIGGWELDLITNELSWSEVTREIHEVASDFKPNLETAITFYKAGWSRNLVAEMVLKAIADGSSWEAEVILVTATGKEIWVKAQGKAEFEAGKCRRIFGAFQDINDQKLFQLKEEQQRANYKALLENIPDRVYSSDMDLNLTSFNTSFYTDAFRFTGIEPKIGKNLVEFSPGLAWDELQSFLNPVLNGFHSSKEDPVPLDGEIYYYEIMASPIFNDSQIQIGISVFSRDITSRKRKEVLVMESREYYKSLFESNPDAVYSLSLDGKLLSGNGELLKLLEISEKDLFKTHFSEFLPDNELEIAAFHFENVKIGIPNEYRTTIRTAKGNIKIVDNRTVPITVNGEIISIFGIAKDLSQSLKIEAERKLILESILDYFYVLDNDYNFTYVNDAVEKILARGSLVGKNVFETFPLLEEGEFYNNLMLAKQTNKPVHFDYYAKELDTWFDENFYPHSDGISVFFRSIDDKKKAERELLDQKIFFEQTFMQSAISTILLDREGYCLKINPTFSSIFGLLPEFVENKIYNVFDDPEIKRQEIDKHIRSMIDKKATLSWETKVDLSAIQSNSKVSDGPTNIFYLHVIGYPILDSDGKVSHVIMQHTDITEIKNAELERDELVKELTKSNKELKQFSYITSHNMRSPLTNLLAISDLIDTSLIADETTVQLIKGFKASTINLNNTLDDLIKILIIKENQGVELRRINFGEVCNLVLKSIESIITESAALIHTNFTGAEEVTFNTSYMESIFLNLLTNSIRYAKKGKKPVIFIYSIKSEEGVKLVFEDDGQGFNMDKVKNKIFGLYQKFHNYPDSKGIGLYLVHTQINSLGGSIELESEVNQGAKFTITFNNRND